MIKDLNYILEKNKNTYEVNKPFPHIRLENLLHGYKKVIEELSRQVAK